MNLNNNMISRKDYIEQKPYWDYQRKIEYNREKVLKGCTNIINYFGETEDGFMLEEGALFEKLWNEITPEDYDEPGSDWVPKDKRLRIEGEVWTDKPIDDLSGHSYFN
tara:strand:+ start:1871 stop:2194 length:324 start_codon:yes stop_codon:yes gene_type:complete